MTSTGPDSKLTPEAVERVRAELQTYVDALAEQISPKSGKRMKDIMAFRTSITAETDRGAALMSAAYLDDKVKELIENRLVQDKKTLRRAFQFNGPLGTFSSRIDFAYLLGILPKNACRDLHTIREIRNQFAHHAAPLSYEDNEIKPFCERLIFHGVKDAAEPDSKFRRTVMGLLAYITLAFDKIASIEAEQDYEIQDRTEAYRIASSVFTRITGAEYPIKHHHE
jgi:DNA-binding MltR family transcriptional regulator